MTQTTPESESKPKPQANDHVAYNRPLEDLRPEQKWWPSDLDYQQKIEEEGQSAKDSQRTQGFRLG